jgi:hypothetical protein
MRKRFDGVVLESIVNFNTKLKEGASFGQPITEFAPTSMGAKDFQSLAREVIANEPKVAPTSELLAHMERLAADAERLLATTTTLVRPESTDPATVRATTSRTPAADSPALKAAVEESLRRRSPLTASTESTSPPKSPLRFEDALPVALSKPVAENPPVNVTPNLATPQQTRLTVPVSLTPPPTVTRIVSPAERLPTPSVPPTSAPASHGEIQQRIDAIYGVRQDGDVVVFRSHSRDAAEIQIAGDFNDWMPHTTPMRRLGDGDFEVRLKLPQGRFRYRLVVDGRWSHDAYNPTIESNEYGELNSVVEVPR